jgi:phage/conjugal plasmid C-4 type zinc finger TraR family protein
MPDEADAAQAYEALDIASAIASAQWHGSKGFQTVIDGVIVCEECEQPIQAARLAAVPGVCRCAECQTEME